MGFRAGRGWPNFIRSIAVILGAALFAVPAFGQQTVGVFQKTPEASEGFILFNPNGNVTYLMDKNGYWYHSWTTSGPAGPMGYLLPDGNLLRSVRQTQDANFAGFNGGGGLIEEYDWDGTLVWSYQLNDAQDWQHHDFLRLPNGNTLMMVWTYKTAAEAIQAGRDPSTIVNNALVPDKIIEVQKTGSSGGNIVWEWNVWDHLIQDFDPTKDNFGVVADHPELININQPTSLADDWTHMNGMGYHPFFNLISLSVREFSEVWIIDHSTSTAEAAGHTGGNYGKGGDLLYRWGNPQAYGRGTAADQVLQNQHDTHFVFAGIPDDGDMIMFNNGTQRGFSSADEIILPYDEFGVFPDPGPTDPWGPALPDRTYVATPPSSLFSPIISGADRVPNGNTIIIEGVQGRVLEVTPAGGVVWEWVNPVGANGIPLNQGDIPTPQGITTEVGLFKVRQYPVDYPAFDGRTLTPQGVLEGRLSPDPVPNGSGTTDAVLVDKLTPTGDQLDVNWDVTSCQQTSDYNILYGDLANVSTLQIDGAQCGVGTSGTHSWNAAPAGNVFFLLVGTDATGIYESSWGTDSSGDQRKGLAASFECGTTTKDLVQTCN